MVGGGRNIDMGNDDILPFIFRWRYTVRSKYIPHQRFSACTCREQVADDNP